MPISPQSLAGWLVGRSRPDYAGQEGSEIIVTALASVPSLPVQIPPKVLDDRSENKLEPFTIAAAADGPVIQFDVTAKAGVDLVEAMTKDDPKHDRTVVLENRVSPTIFSSIAVTEMPRPKLITRLAPGTYRLCARYFDHQLTGCDAPTYELLPSTAMSATLSAVGTEK